jgi:hypothetical protein
VFPFWEDKLFDSRSANQLPLGAATPTTQKADNYGSPGSNVLILGVAELMYDSFVLP